MVGLGNMCLGSTPLLTSQVKTRLSAFESYINFLNMPSFLFLQHLILSYSYPFAACISPLCGVCEWSMLDSGCMSCLSTLWEET